MAQHFSLRVLPAVLLIAALGRCQSAGAESRPVRISDAFLLPEAVASFGAAMLGDELFVVGGHVGTEHVHSQANLAASVRRRRMAPKGDWMTEDGPRLQSVALVAARDGLIRIGGLSARNAEGEDEDLWSVADVARRTRDASAWEALPPLPAPRSSHDATVLGDRIFVAGGWTLAGTARTWADAACILDLGASAPEWKTVPQPFRRRALAVAASRGQIYAIGGLDDEGEPSRRVDVFDPKENSWSQGPDLPWPAFGAGAYGDDTMLVASAIDGRVVRLEDDGRSWKTIGALAVPRFMHRIVRSPEGELLFVGGAGKDGHVRLVERFDPEADGKTARYVRVRIPWPGAAKNRQAAILEGRELTLIGGNKSLGQHDFEPEHFLDEAWRLDLGALEATRLEPLPVRRQSLVVAQPVSSRSSGDKGRAKKEEVRPAWMLGGFGSEKAGAERTFADAFTYQGDRAIPAAPLALPEPLTQFGVAADASSLWIFGGLDYDRSRGDEEAFRHRDRIWVSREGGAFEDAGVRMPSARRAFGYALKDRSFYVAGGLEDGFKVVDDFAAFDLESKQWKALRKPAPRISPELVAFDGALWLAGGANRAAPPPFLERYDPKLDAWTTILTEPPFDPANIRVAAHRGRLMFWSTQRKEAVLDLAWLVLPPR